MIKVRKTCQVIDVGLYIHVHVYQSIKEYDSSTNLLRRQKGAHLLPLKRRYKSELHRIKSSFSSNFKNKEK